MLNKPFLKDIVSNVGVLLPFSTLMKWSRQNLFLPFYHAVDVEAMPHIRHLYQPRSLRQFESDLDILLTHFQPIGLQDLIRFSKERRLPDKPSFHLSFDDGLRQVYEVIFPILKRKGVPASLFINSAFLDNAGLMYRYKASLLIEHIQNEDATAKKHMAAQLNSKADDLSIKSSLLQIRYQEQAVLDEIAYDVGLDFDHFLKEYQPYLTTSQLKELADSSLIDVGLHSHDHPFFHQLDRNQQLDQLDRNRAILGAACPDFTPAFAFPFTDDGVSSSFFDELYQRGVLVSFGTAGLKLPVFAQKHYQRFPMEGNHQKADKLIRGEYLSYLGKRLIGKHRVRYKGEGLVG